MLKALQGWEPLKALISSGGLRVRAPLSWRVPDPLLDPRSLPRRLFLPPPWCLSPLPDFLSGILRPSLLAQPWQALLYVSHLLLWPLTLKSSKDLVEMILLVMDFQLMDLSLDLWISEKTACMIFAVRCTFPPFSW